jgi:hypothetical protein
MCFGGVTDNYVGLKNTFGDFQTWALFKKKKTVSKTLGSYNFQEFTEFHIHHPTVPGHR